LRREKEKKIEQNKVYVYIYIVVLPVSCVVLHLLAHAISAFREREHGARKRNVAMLTSTSAEDGHGLIDLEHRMLG
jgi:hypothetical protein